MEIKINDNTYKTQFNVNALFATLRHYGYKKLSDLNEIFNMGDDPEIWQIEGLSVLAQKGIKEDIRINRREQELPDVEDLNVFLFEDTARIEQVANEAMEAMPGQEESQNGQGEDKKKGQNQPSKKSKA